MPNRTSHHPTRLVSYGLVLGLAACTAPADEDVASDESAIAAGVYGTAGAGLNVRAEPTTSSAVVGVIPAERRVEIACQIAGGSVDGNRVWNYIAAYGGYASDAHLWTGYDGFAPGVPRCSASRPGGGGGGGGRPAASAGPRLPLACGASAVVTQGNGGGFSHTGAAHYGFDFGVNAGTPLTAVEDGVVSLVRSDVRPGNPCYSGGGPSCANTANYVVVAHADGTDSAYLHINAATVAPGQRVARGDRVALSGGTGWSTGPHAHVQRQQRCGIWWCQSVPMRFADVSGGVPGTGQSVTSQNCR